MAAEVAVGEVAKTGRERQEETEVSVVVAAQGLLRIMIVATLAGLANLEVEAVRVPVIQEAAGSSAVAQLVQMVAVVELSAELFLVMGEL